MPIVYHNACTANITLQCMPVVQADAQGTRDYRSGADLPSPQGGGRPVPRGPAELAAAVLRRIAPWTRASRGSGGSSGDVGGSGSGSGDGSDDIDAMLQHDAAEVGAPCRVYVEPATHDVLWSVAPNCKIAKMHLHSARAALTCVTQSQDARMWRMSIRHSAAHASSTAASDTANRRATDKTALQADDPAGNLLLY